SGTPRFDHDPVTHAPKGMLIEEARTNLFTRSSEFDNSAWAKISSNLTANAITAPDGTMTADKLASAANTNQHYIYQGSLTLGTSYTISVYAKAAEETNFSLNLAYNSGGSNFNLSTGTITSTSFGTARMTSVGNGWFHCAIVVTPTVATAALIQLRGRALIYTGDGTSGIYIWGAQLEQGAFPTSYIPTTTAAVTRAADALTMPTGSWYNANSGSLYAEADTMPYNGSLSGAISIAFFNDVTTNNEWGLRFDAGGTNTASPYVAGGVNQTTIYTLPVLSGINKTVHAMSSNTRSTVGNGGTVRTGTYSSPPAITTLDIGKKYPSSYLNGWIQRAKYYPLNISDTQLQLMTQ
ncbi:MAG TPA: hypothetical protein PLE43_09895, partial [Alphaproteobacteria bacterium]|nr:hypothetical protein [Alphaproteobacteria bacterium]